MFNKKIVLKFILSNIHFWKVSWLDVAADWLGRTQEIADVVKIIRKQQENGGKTWLG